MVIIKTRDFTLRPITLNDAQGYLECHQDKEAEKSLISTPKNIVEAKKEIKYLINKGALNFAIEVNGNFIGFISLESHYDPRNKHAAIVNYVINHKFRGKGLATKAVKIVTDYGFKKLKLKRISGICRTFNKASARVFEKAGFKLEGILKKNKYKNGEYLDDMLWAKIK